MSPPEQPAEEPASSKLYADQPVEMAGDKAGDDAVKPAQDPTAETTAKADEATTAESTSTPAEEEKPVEAETKDEKSEEPEASAENNQTDVAADTPPADEAVTVKSDQPSTPTKPKDSKTEPEPQPELEPEPKPEPEHKTEAEKEASTNVPDAMSASALTIKPVKHDRQHDPSTQFLTPTSSSYVDPTPATPMTSQPPSRSPSSAARSFRSNESSPSRSGAESEGKRYATDEEQDGGSRSEIQSIMEQFSEAGGGPGAEEVMSPRLEITAPIFGNAVQHPPRKSSLEPLASSISGQVQEMGSPQISTSSPNEQAVDDEGPPVPPKDGTFGTPPRNREQRAASSITSPTSPQHSMHRPPPPEPEPESTLPFDFHRFLEQLRNKKADPVARYLKSFLTEFGKRQWMVHEQVKIIGDFLAFIANKMMLCEVWRDVSDAEFDNAREGMEKLVMNRLYTQTFSPAIPAPKPIPGAKPKKRGGEPPLGPGRRGQHQEDVERDDIVTQKINIYGWIKEEHLDIPQIGDSGRRFLKLAQQELLKIKSYRAPRDKIICVLNCCKVIFGLLKHNKSDSSADSFMPLLIFVVLQSNPEHLVSNVQYILRFRNQDRLGGEAGYYLSSLMGAVQFIENMDRTSLTISDDEFEKSVEAAVSAIAERNQAMSPTIRQQATFSEKPIQPGLSPRQSTDDPSTPQRQQSSDQDGEGEGAAISGLLRTIQKPLSTIGRIFADEGGSPSSSTGPNSARQSPRFSSDGVRDSARHTSPSRPQLSAEEAAARQASAETAEAQRLQRAEHANVVETLSGMFPDLDKDIISDVVYQKEGRVGLAVDACLALST